MHSFPSACWPTIGNLVIILQHKKMEERELQSTMTEAVAWYHQATSQNLAQAKQAPVLIGNE